MKKLSVNSLFEKAFAPLDWGQSQQLEQSMLSGLTKEPIFWWLNPITGFDEILDGHTRYSIAQKHGLEPEFEEKVFETEGLALAFVLRVQTRRRNVEGRIKDDARKKAVDLEVLAGKSKTEAIQDVASESGDSERTIWRAVEEQPKPTAIQAFYASKKEYDRDLERTRTKAVEKLKQRAQKEGWHEDESRLESEWNEVEEQIQAEFADRTVEIEQLADVAQTEQELNPGVRNASGKRTTKKSVQAIANRRNALKKAITAILKLSEAIRECSLFVTELETGEMVIQLRTFQIDIEKVQTEMAADVAKKKKKFGR